MSPDSPRRHVKVREKYGLPAPVQPSVTRPTKKYGTWVEESMYGDVIRRQSPFATVIDYRVKPPGVPS